MGDTIIPRKQWGALPPKPAIKEQEYKLPLPEVIDYLVVHKTHLPRSLTPQALQRRAQDGRENKVWDDIPYHYYITWNGKIYEGREMRYVGGHAGKSKEALAGKERKEPDFIKKDPDYGSIGIALAGYIDPDLQKDLASKAQIESLKWLIGYLRARYPRVTLDHVLLHKEIDDKITRTRGYTPAVIAHTDCPGRGVSKQVERLRK